jgi:DNA-binding protein H-NS
MALKKDSLATLSNEALCKLRDEIVVILNSRAEELRKELDQLTAGGLVVEREPFARNFRRHRKAFKLAPKYRGPDGSTWSGRGLKPRWMVKEMNAGKKPEDFLIVPPGKNNDSYIKQ